MNRSAFHLDEDIQALSLLNALRSRRVDVTTANEANMGAATDEEQLLFAAQQGRVLVSGNVADFPRLHAEFLAARRDHAGIIMVRQRQFPPGEMMRRLAAFSRRTSREEARNRLYWLSGLSVG